MLVVSRSMETKRIFRWANFVTDLTLVTRTLYMLGLDVILQSLPSLVLVRALEALELATVQPSHFRRYQNIQGT